MIRTFPVEFQRREKLKRECIMQMNELEGGEKRERQREMERDLIGFNELAPTHYSHKLLVMH